MAPSTSVPSSIPRRSSRMNGIKYKLAQSANTRYGTHLRRRCFVGDGAGEVRAPSPSCVVSSEAISTVGIVLAARKGFESVQFARGGSYRIVAVSAGSGREYRGDSGEDCIHST